MVVRRVLGGVILGGLAAPLLAAAPLPPPPPGITVTRVFARAVAETSPVPSASPAPSPAAGEPAPPRPAAASTPSPEVAARARAELDANRAGKIDRTHYTADMSARMTDATLAEVSKSLAALGSVKSFTQVRKFTQGALTLYVFRVEFEKPPVVEEAIAWNAAGKVELIQFRARSSEQQ